MKKMAQKVAIKFEKREVFEGQLNNTMHSFVLARDVLSTLVQNRLELPGQQYISRIFYYPN